jgi:hypothetical protein
MLRRQPLVLFILLTVLSVGPSVTSASAQDTDITVEKIFYPAGISPGGVSMLEIAVASPVARTDLAMTDLYPAGLVNAASPAPSSSCGGVVTASVGGSSFTFSGGSPEASTYCYVRVFVTAASGGSLTNVIPAGAVTASGGAANSAAASATLHVSSVQPPDVSMTFADTPILSNGTSTLRITFTNWSTTAISGLAFTNTYPSGMTNASVPAVANSCGGTLVASPGGGTIALSNGGIGARPQGTSYPLPARCTVAVTVTASTPGQYTNVLPAGSVTTTTTPPNSLPISATLTVTGPPAVGVAKTFSSTEIAVSGITTLRIVLTNPREGSMAGLSFTDTFPAGLEVADPTLVSNGCGGVFLASAGGGMVSLTGGSLAAFSTCLITVPVTATTTGTKTNIIPVGAVTASNAEPNTEAASATLTVRAAAAAPIPAFSWFALLALALAVSSSAAWILRR